MNIFFLWIHLALSVEYPSWVTRPSSHCSSDSLCAMGEGKTFAEAASDARGELARIFLSKIEKKFTLRKNTTTETDKTKTEQKVAVFLKEYTSEELKGVEILKRFTDGKTFFALAVMDKRKSASLLKKEIDNLDEKIQVFLRTNRYGNLVLAIKLLKTRKKLEERHLFLTGRTLPEKITFSQILHKKRKKQMGKTVSIRVKAPDAGNDLKQTLREILNREGFVVVEKDVYDVLVHVTIEAKKEYIQVEGFEKYTFLMGIVIKDKNDRQIDSLDFSAKGTGRNFSHAYGSIVLNIKNHIKDNLYKLNMGGNR